ncbi:hypothetical protein [Pantoea agglomerans]|uniref:hypothetical protein n=1 Tax=Enterobacter agglomerans TaxID=549 RepID=UPI0016548269|nr:hypothetical protein [Pantoea agglomerans]MCX2192525.1 hypothetical protein [Pantoea agglomerans]
MKKYPHGLTLIAVCAAIEDYQRHQDSVPEEGILAAFNTLLGHSDIAAALRALEKRAEAAEAKAKHLNDGWLNAIAERDEARTEQGKLAAARSVRDNWKERAWAAEEKLEELEKQQAVGVARMEMATGKEGLRYYKCFVDMRPDLVVAELNTGMELFTRPAPAVSLAKLMPEGWRLVPVEPTEEMIAAGDQFMDGLSRLGNAYEAMLAAAPEVE